MYLCIVAATWTPSVPAVNCGAACDISVSGSTLILSSSAAYSCNLMASNSGTIQVDAGATLTVGGLYNMAGGAIVGNGGNLILAGASAGNVYGTITALVAGSIIDLGTTQVSSSQLDIGGPGSAPISVTATALTVVAPAHLNLNQGAIMSGNIIEIVGERTCSDSCYRLFVRTAASHL
jgi:hypothetical protein